MSTVPIKIWTPERILTLIEIYKQHPALWDPGHKDFKNSELKSTIWTNIAETIGSRDAERKMNILIVQFRREMKKINERILAGKSKNEAATKWFAFEAMSFIKGKVRKSKIPFALTPTNVSQSEPESCNQKKEIQSPTWKQNFFSPTSCIENVEYDPVSSTKTSNEIRDEYSAFGEMVAIKLRKLSNTYAKNKAMNLITNSLFQVEIECAEAECEETEMVFVKTLEEDR